MKSKILMVTGKTEQQWIDEMKIVQLAQEQGLKKPSVRTCYLCKRADGDTSLCLNPDNQEEVVLNPIELFSYQVPMGEGVTLSYLLCIECAHLLGVIDKMEEQSGE